MSRSWFLATVLVVLASVDGDATREPEGASGEWHPPPARRLGRPQDNVPPFLSASPGRPSANGWEGKLASRDVRPGPPPSCTELYFDQPMDHFGPSPGTYQHRYFVGDDFHGGADGQSGGPIFFYLGNEADVTLYVNATGLMWENAADFGALVVFAEHRYYGKSQLFEDPLSNLSYLSSDQALMDYVTLIEHLKTEYHLKDSDAVIGFGGSYGGMLSSWARLRYPHVFDGVIAASAPILAFEGLEDYFDPQFFPRGLEYDVSTRGGVSSFFCHANLQKAFGPDRGLSQADPALIRSQFQLCPDDATADADLGHRATIWLNDALSVMSMGNFPYPSGYILNGDGLLPAFPVRAACEHLREDWTGDDQLGDWLSGLASFAGVYYNYSGALDCNTLSAPVNNESSVVDTLWDYQYCSQLFMVGGQGPDEYDLYWDQLWNGTTTADRCRAKYGFLPDREHIALSYGTPNDWSTQASNIVWSQGEYDPWRGGGVQTSLSDSLVAFVIPEAAHHLDLFFSHPNDTQDVIAARRREVAEISRWINEKKERFRSRGFGTTNMVFGME